MTIVLTEFENKQTAVLASSGGGEGVFNFSWFAEQDYVNSCADALKECGFEYYTLFKNRKPEFIKL